MPNVRIKALDGRIATSGLHFGRGPLVPKLEPGEVVFLEEGPEFEALWATGKLELTRDPPTRPLKYENEHEAMYCRPSYKPKDAADAERMRLVREEVARRLASTRTSAPPKAPEAGLGPHTEPGDAAPTPRRSRRRPAVHAPDSA